MYESLAERICDSQKFMQRLQLENLSHRVDEYFVYDYVALENAVINVEYHLSCGISLQKPQERFYTTLLSHHIKNPKQTL